MEICFATNNAHKLEEVQAMLPAGIQLKTLKQIGCTEELPEEQDTIEGNARQKAEFVWQRYHANCFADDTGLEVTALGNEPGVDTAHYAGPERDNVANMQKVLRQLKGNPDRSARFRTVIALVLGGVLHTFEGVVEGLIADAPAGEGGFGYDPIFIPEGHDVTFAQLGPAEKNRISHRGRATQQLVAFLEQQKH